MGMRRCGQTGAKLRQVKHEGASMGRACVGVCRHGIGCGAMEEGSGMHR